MTTHPEAEVPPELEDDADDGDAASSARKKLGKLFVRGARQRAAAPKAASTRR